MKPWTWTVLLVALCVVGMVTMVLPFVTIPFPHLGLGTWLFIVAFGSIGLLLVVNEYRRGIDRFNLELVAL